MRRNHCVGVTRASAASIMASLALLCVPTLSAAAEPDGSPAADRADAVLAFGAGYAKPQGESRVRALQRRLRALGHQPGPVDGIYGPRTEAAVERLQRDSGLAVDGIVGPQTRRLLNAEAPPLAPGAGYGRPGGSPRVRAIQRRLRALGSRPGAVDGIYGPRTRAAVERFQRSVREPASGVLSAATVAALARAGKAQPSRANDTQEEPAGGSDPSTTRTPTVADDRIETKDETGSTSPVPLVVLALALAASGGLLAVWLRSRRRRPGTSPAADRPVQPGPMSNGDGKAARSNGSTASASSAPRPGAVALGYVSVGEAAAVDGPELRDQVAAIDTACRERGLVLSEVIRDLEQVEVPGSERPGMQHALQRIATREASCLVVADLGRLSHSAHELGHIVGLLRQQEARLVAVDEGLDTATKSGVKAADQLVSVCAATGKPPRAARDRGSSRPARTDTPALDERIQAMRASGMSLQAIADRLNAENVPTLRGGTKWRPSAIQQATRGDRNGRRGSRGTSRRPTPSRTGGGSR
jgi:peptidoglycan hydrolase-like protein with peptidoglycan-binding domain